MDDDSIKIAAETFAREHKKEIARELTDTEIFIHDPTPISVFIAGSPGAGKTEISKNLISILELNQQHKVVRIDGDELRNRMPGYTGTNSFLFQSAVSIIVDKIHDCVLEHSQTFLLDGTFSQYERACKNINRSLEKGRPILIFYVFQTPEVAWKFTQAREATEGRNIPKDAFIKQFIAAHDTVQKISETLNNKVRVIFIKKNFETHAVDEIVEIATDGRSIDELIGHAYTEDDLQKLLI